MLDLGRMAIGIDQNRFVFQSKKTGVATRLTFGQAIDVAEVPLRPFGTRAVGPLSGLLAADVMLSMATAPRRRVLSRGIGATSAGVLGLAVAVGVKMAATAIAGPIAGYIAGAAAGFVSDPIIRDTVSKGIDWFTDIENKRRFNMGGNYEDTEYAYTQRQRGAMEIGQSLLNARQYLGKEALLMHQ